MTKEISLKFDNNDDIKKYAIEYLDNQIDHLSDQQKKQFISICTIHKLNPLKSEIFASVYGGKMQVVVAWRVYNKRVLASGLFDGWYIFENESDLKIDRKDPTNPSITMGVLRKGCINPFFKTVFLKENQQITKDGLPNKFWKQKPFTMLEKVARSQLLRLAFDDIIDGLPYVEDEILTDDSGVDSSSDSGGDSGDEKKAELIGNLQSEKQKIDVLLEKINTLEDATAVDLDAVIADDFDLINKHINYFKLNIKNQFYVVLLEKKIKSMQPAKPAKPAKPIKNEENAGVEGGGAEQNQPKKEWGSDFFKS